MKEKPKLITVRIDVSDFELLRQAQANLKITSFNTIIKQVLYNKESIYDLYTRSLEFKDSIDNNKKEN